MNIRRHTLLGLFCFCFSAALFAAEPEEVFQSLFGDKYNRAKATGIKTDDVALASELLNAAKTVPDSPKIQILLCRKAMELGSEYRTGYPTAIAAGELWASVAPQDKPTIKTLLLELYEKQYQTARGLERKEAAVTYTNALLETAAAQAEAGDSEQAIVLYKKAIPMARFVKEVDYAVLKDQIQSLESMLVMDRRIKQLKADVLDDPTQQNTVMELTRLLLVERDNLPEAAKYAPFLTDPDWKTNMALAGRQADKIQPMEQLKLAQWFGQLANDAEHQGKINMLSEARDRYDIFLNTYDKQDMFYLKAKVARQQAEKQLKALGGKRLREADFAGAGGSGGTPGQAVNWRFDQKEGPVHQFDLPDGQLRGLLVKPDFSAILIFMPHQQFSQLVHVKLPEGKVLKTIKLPYQHNARLKGISTDGKLALIMDNPQGRPRYTAWFEVDTGKQIGKLDWPGDPVFNADGSKIYVLNNTACAVYDTRTGKQIDQFQWNGITTDLPDRVRHVEPSSDNRYALIVPFGNGKYLLFNTEDPKKSKSLDVKAGNFRQWQPGISPDNQVALVASNPPHDKNEKPTSVVWHVFDLKTGKQLNQFKIETNKSTSAIPLPGGKYAIVNQQNYSNTTELYDLKTGKNVSDINKIRRPLAITPKGQYLLSYNNKHLLIYQLNLK